MRLRYYIGDFFKALWKDWVALMSGIASIALAFWAAYFPPASVAAGRTLLWITAVVCFIVATFSLWYKERRAHENTRAELETLKRESAPKLLARFDQIVVGTSASDPNTTGIILVVSVRNLGMSSIAAGWDATINMRDGGVLPTNHMAILGPINYAGEGGAMQHYSEADALYNKAKVQPIAKGAEVTGVLLFLVENISKDVLVATGETITLSFEDVTHKRYAITHSLPGPGGTPMYHPGLQPPSAPPLHQPKQPRKVKRRRKT